MLYDFLAQSLDILPGIGRTIQSRLSARGVETIGDLLLHLPVDYIDDRHIQQISSIKPEQTVRIQACITGRHISSIGAKKQLTLHLQDASGHIKVIFFHAQYLIRDARLQEGREITLRGKVQRWAQSYQMSHPEWSVPEAFTPGFYPKYASLAGLSAQRLAKFIQAALRMLKSQHRSPWDKHFPITLAQAWREVHQPADVHTEAFSQAWKRLKSEELLVYLKLMQDKRHQAERPAPSFRDVSACQVLKDALPYPLTRGQQQAWSDIQADLQSGKRMHRLIQGDVGSGKTWVAALAIMQTVTAGYQAALMVPTEVLARQHMQSLSELLKPLGVNMACLTGSSRQSERKKICNALQKGELQLLVGTHALLSDGVNYQALGLAIVDEQHRFGVKQRWALTEKSGTDEWATHLLVMTATPIPRTLALSLYGDMDMTVMQGMPVGRKPVETRILPSSKFPQLAEGMRRLLSENGRIYWIVSRIDDDDDESPYCSVDARLNTLKTHFADEGVVGLHGRMKPKEKQQALRAFAEGECRILVSTTVVEVGVNVPEARLIVIEDADTYGLAQLHQLRGRVGRSSQQSYCMLIPSAQASELALKRLQAMVDCHDGLTLAEMDLELRGAGDAIGTRQSGEAGFRTLDLQEDIALVRYWHEHMPKVEPTEAMIRFWRPLKESVD